MQVQIIELNRDGQNAVTTRIILSSLHNPCRVARFSLPCVYALLPHKTEKTYIIIELLSEETNPNPGKKLADFQKAALVLPAKKFSHAKISCCYFHLTQSFKRKINDIGLKTYYEKFPEFNLALRRLPALAHVPPTHVKASFELVIEVRKCRKSNIFKKLPGYYAPSAPVKKKLKKMEIIRSTYEFENAVQ